MDLNAFLNLLLSSANPLLPDPAALRWALHGVWAVVLGSGTALLAGKLARPYRIGLTGWVMLWTVLPGAVSPAHWLGLAFQTPSLMSAVICLGWLWAQARQWSDALRSQAAPPPQPQPGQCATGQGVC